MCVLTCEGRSRRHGQTLADQAEILESGRIELAGDEELELGWELHQTHSG
jgi:hypothetical protein